MMLDDGEVVRLKMRRENDRKVDSICLLLGSSLQQIF
jgi:hypothetical protein